MKLSCTPISYSASMKAGETQDDYFRLIAENGAEGSDLMEPNAYPWFWQDFDLQKKDVLARMKDYGLALSGYAAGNNFTVGTDEEFDRQVAIVKSAIHDAAEFGAPCLRIFGGYHEGCGGRPGVTASNGLAMVIRGIEAVLPEAEKCGVTLALENHGRMPGLSREMLYLLKYFDSENLRTLFDCANYLGGNMDETEDPLQAFERLKDYVVHCHVKSIRVAPPDAKRPRVGCVAGEGGIVPLRQFYYALAAYGYEGFCSLEYEGGTYTPEEIGVPQSLRNLADMQKSALTYQIR